MDAFKLFRNNGRCFFSKPAWFSIWCSESSVYDNLDDEHGQYAFLRSNRQSPIGITLVFPIIIGLWGDFRFGVAFCLHIPTWHHNGAKYTTRSMENLMRYRVKPYSECKSLKSSVRRLKSPNQRLKAPVAPTCWVDVIMGTEHKSPWRHGAKSLS